MFAEHTKASILALATVDGGVTVAERESLSRLLCGSQKSGSVVRYGEAAKRLRLSLPTLKRLVKDGRLTKVIGTGRRAFGITEESLLKFCG